MRLLLAALALAVVWTSAAPAFAQVYVRPYVRNDGGYVQPHIRSLPNGSVYDNYGYRRNNFAAPPSQTLPTFPTFPYSH